MEKQVVLLFSSGLDSFLANDILSKQWEDINLHRIYFNLNSRYSHNEQKFLSQKYADKHWRHIVYSDVLNIKHLEEESAYVPNRNLMLVTMASAQFPYADEIYINGMKDDRVADNNGELFTSYSKTLSKSIGKKVEIKSLFWDIEKGGAVRNYVNNGGNILNLVENTYSCFSNVYNEHVYNVYFREDIVGNKNIIDNSLRHDTTYTYFGGVNITGCMRCKACFRRICALTEGNIYIPFLDKEIVEWYKNNVDRNEHPVRFKTIQNYSNFLEFYDREKSITI